MSAWHRTLLFVQCCSALGSFLTAALVMTIAIFVSKNNYMKLKKPEFVSSAVLSLSLISGITFVFSISGFINAYCFLPIVMNSASRFPLMRFLRAQFQQDVFGKQFHVKSNAYFFQQNVNDVQLIEKGQSLLALPSKALKPSPVVLIHHPTKRMFREPTRTSDSIVLSQSSQGKAKNRKAMYQLRYADKMISEGDTTSSSHFSQSLIPAAETALARMNSPHMPAPSAAPSGNATSRSPSVVSEKTCRILGELYDRGFKKRRIRPTIKSLLTLETDSEKSVIKDHLDLPSTNNPSFRSWLPSKHRVKKGKRRRKLHPKERKIRPSLSLTDSSTTESPFSKVEYRLSTVVPKGDEAKKDSTLISTGSDNVSKSAYEETSISLRSQTRNESHSNVKQIEVQQSSEHTGTRVSNCSPSSLTVTTDSIQAYPSQLIRQVQHNFPKKRHKRRKHKKRRMRKRRKPSNSSTGTLLPTRDDVFSSCSGHIQYIIDRKKSRLKKRRALKREQDSSITT